MRVCEVCGGDGYLVGDAVDSRGERTDDVVDCPACPPDDDYPDFEEGEDRMAPLEKAFWQSLSACASSDRTTE